LGEGRSERGNLSRCQKKEGQDQNPRADLNQKGKGRVEEHQIGRQRDYETYKKRDAKYINTLKLGRERDTEWGEVHYFLGRKQELSWKSRENRIRSMKKKKRQGGMKSGATTRAKQVASTIGKEILEKSNSETGMAERRQIVDSAVENEKKEKHLHSWATA